MIFSRLRKETCDACVPVPDEPTFDMQASGSVAAELHAEICFARMEGNGVFREVPHLLQKGNKDGSSGNMAATQCASGHAAVAAPADKLQRSADPVDMAASRILQIQEAEGNYETGAAAAPGVQTTQQDNLAFGASSEGEDPRGKKRATPNCEDEPPRKRRRGLSMGIMRLIPTHVCQLFGRRRRARAAIAAATYVRATDAHVDAVQNEALLKSSAAAAAAADGLSVQAAALAADEKVPNEAPTATAAPAKGDAGAEEHDLPPLEALEGLEALSLGHAATELPTDAAEEEEVQPAALPHDGNIDEEPVHGILSRPADAAQPTQEEKQGNDGEEDQDSHSKAEHVRGSWDSQAASSDDDQVFLTTLLR